LTYIIATENAPNGFFPGEVVMFAGITPPPGFFVLDGRQLPIVGNEALFRVIGNQYGGDGSSNFNLPNLIGVSPIGRLSGESPVAPQPNPVLVVVLPDGTSVPANQFLNGTVNTQNGSVNLQTLVDNLVQTSQLRLQAAEVTQALGLMDDGPQEIAFAGEENQMAALFGR
jgi:microcystin-dependent protein